MSDAQERTTPPRRVAESEIGLAGEIVKTKCTAPVQQSICWAACTGRTDCPMCTVGSAVSA